MKKERELIQLARANLSLAFKTKLAFGRTLKAAKLLRVELPPTVPKPGGEAKTKR
jgi:hypothetical protein